MHIFIFRKSENNFYEAKYFHSIMIVFYYFSRVENTVFKSLTEAVRETEVQKQDPDQVMRESRSS